MNYRSRREDYNNAGYRRRYEGGGNLRQKPQKARRKTFSTSLTSCSTLGRSVVNFVSILDLRLEVTWKTLGHVQKLTILWYLERYQTIRGSKPLTVISKLNNAHEQYKHSWISSILSSFSRQSPALIIIFCHYAECRSPLSCRHELHGQYWHRSPNLVQVWCYHRS
jgi:hypothetical protein